MITILPYRDKFNKVILNEISQVQKDKDSNHLYKDFKCVAHRNRKFNLVIRGFVWRNVCIFWGL